MSSQEDYLDSLLKGIVEDEDSDANGDYQGFDMSDVDDLLRSVSEQFFAGEDILGSADDASEIGDFDAIGDIGGNNDSAGIKDATENNGSGDINEEDGVGEIDLADSFVNSDSDNSDELDNSDAQAIQDLLGETGVAEGEPMADDLTAMFDAASISEASAEEYDDEEDEGYEPNLDDASDLIALLQGAGEEEMDIPSLSDITDVELPEHTDEAEEASDDDISLEALIEDMNSLTADSDIASSEGDGGASNPMESLLGAVGIGDLFGTASEDELVSGGMDDGIADLMDLDLGQDESKIASKKGGIFSRIWNFLTEEDEEEEETTKGNEDVPLSDENKTVIEEVEKEKKKKKKDKKKKKKGQQEDEEIFDDDEAPADDKKKKKDKKKKEKKKKEEPAEGLEPPVPEKKLSGKRVATVGAVCLTIALVILISSNLLTEFMVKNTAREAFYDEDYLTCYQNLYGKDLNDSDEVMLRKSECILRIRMWVEEYEAFEAAGSKVEALDSLIQSVNDYAELKAYATEWAIEAEVANEYASILSSLTEKYQLTEEQAKEIAAIKDDVQYTKVVTAIAGGETYSEAPEREERLEDLKDVLPEEKELLEKIFGNK